MATQTIQNPILSFPEIIQIKEPKAVFENRLIVLLSKNLKKLGIIWSPKAFKGGLNNPDLPPTILKKLESLIFLAETIDWKLSKPLAYELDTVVEDIETFNPAFRARLKKMTQEAKAGKFISFEELRRKLALVKNR